MTLFFTLLLLFITLCFCGSLSFSLSICLNPFPSASACLFYFCLTCIFFLFLGLTFGSKTISNNLNSKAKSAVPKSSTLMKPTASQLAKQNHPAKNIGSRWWLIRIIFLFLVVKETWFFSWVGEVEWQYELPFILKCNILLHCSTLSLFARSGALI